MGERSREPRDQFSFNPTSDVQGVRSLIEGDATDRLVAAAGRILALRDQGKLVFSDMHDQTGSIQLIAQDGLTPDLEAFKRHSIGDWVGITGQAGLSRRGEPSISIEDWVTLAKTEVPFPSKQGLNDPETIARQRYLDLAVNAESRDRLRTRSKITSIIRRELEDQDFLEVETPTLQPIHGGAEARPFQTHHNALDIDLYMRVAPELYLKRLVVGGLTRVFEMGKVFRNEGISTRHNPEFTMMEVYAAYWDHKDQMKLTEDLISGIAQEIHGSTVIEYGGKQVDLTTPWRRAPMGELVSEKIGKEVSVSTPVAELRALCEEHDIPYEASYGAGKLLLELYEKTVEHTLWGPIFVTEHPKEVSPLARSHRSKPGVTERFEAIIAGRETCNGFSELNDPKEQWERFKEQEIVGEHDDEAMRMDHDYIRALKYGLPPTAGLGIGIDRLAMLMTDAPSIRDVILFPTLKPDGHTTSY